MGDAMTAEDTELIQRNEEITGGEGTLAEP